MNAIIDATLKARAPGGASLYLAVSRFSITLPPVPRLFSRCGRPSHTAQSPDRAFEADRLHLAGSLDTLRLLPLPLT